jgi:transposase
MFLLPPSLRDWLPENHLVYFVSDVVDQLDLSKIESVYEKDDRGQPPFNPRMMTKILVYAYCVGVFSSRRIQKRLIEDIGFRVLAAGNQPDFRTISDFRKIHLDALQNLFEQVLQLALTAGAIKLGRVALDGTKIKSNAPKHKAMSYKRMKEEARNLRAEVQQLLKQAKAADDEEDARYGKDNSGDELPEELSRRETRLGRIKEAKKALEQRAREEVQKPKEHNEPEKKAVPEDKAQYNCVKVNHRLWR